MTYLTRVGKVLPIRGRDAHLRRQRSRRIMRDQFRGDERDRGNQSHHGSSGPGDRAGWQIVVHRARALDESDHSPQILIAQEIELGGWHEQQRSPVRADSVADRPCPVLLRVETSNTARARGQIRGDHAADGVLAKVAREIAEADALTRRACRALRDGGTRHALPGRGDGPECVGPGRAVTRRRGAA